MRMGKVIIILAIVWHKFGRCFNQCPLELTVRKTSSHIFFPFPSSMFYPRSTSHTLEGSHPRLSPCRAVSLRIFSPFDRGDVRSGPCLRPGSKLHHDNCDVSGMLCLLLS
ncbi:hypothetical protein PAXRUDRAFT_401129 [Paxillus rubicundulus Ve08.2h10]|uniref:Secreted protein n=1 Tax=Paxillus rubicundulus Ve08.2h10 TaxID=930991 RepID=A0A0D0E311_9AGAM|nr:hypothetical protein PAXRUDRAFT_401129 [Paxillus rubicundulus Ve08.2h10]